MDANKLPLKQLDSLFSAIAQELEEAMEGSSGVLLGIFFSRAGQAINEGKDWPGSLEMGLDKMKEIGGAKKDGRTMLNPLYRAVEKLKQKKDDLAGAAKEARMGADLAKELDKADGGRSENVKDLKGKKDPGAEAIALVFERLYQKLK